jgi:hypothetical protein
VASISSIRSFAQFKELWTPLWEDMINSSHWEPREMDDIGLHMR